MSSSDTCTHIYKYNELTTQVYFPSPKTSSPPHSSPSPTPHSDAETARTSQRAHNAPSAPGNAGPAAPQASPDSPPAHAGTLAHRLITPSHPVKQTSEILAHLVVLLPRKLLHAEIRGVDEGQVEPYTLGLAVAEGTVGWVPRVRGFEGCLEPEVVGAGEKGGD